MSLHYNSKMLITGHSLGAALATLAALDIKRRLAPTNHIDFYTFGSPRVGNVNFTNYLMEQFPDGKYDRVTHYNDMVAHVPPPIMGFNHGGNEVWYKNSGDDLTWVECENAPF
jgi:predicted lipase